MQKFLLSLPFNHNIGLGIRGVYVNSSIVDKGALVKIYPLHK